MKKTIMLLADEPDLRRLVRRSLEKLGLRVVEAGDDLTAAAQAGEISADLVAVDEATMETTCIPLTRLRAENAALRSELRSSGDAEDEQERGEGHARNLTAMLWGYERLSMEIERAHYETAMRLIGAAQLKTDELSGHLSRIAMLAAEVARALGVREEGIRVLTAAAPLHDIGKIGIPDEILTKPGPLTVDEWELVKRHTLLGARILSNSSSRLLHAAREIALTHHERWDGSGYPRGLEGQEIPLFGRIVMLADQYDALRCERPYKPALDHDSTCRILLDGDGRTEPEHFDPAVLEAFEGVSGRFAEIFESIEDGDAKEPLGAWLASLPALPDRTEGAATPFGIPTRSPATEVGRGFGVFCPHELVELGGGRAREVDD